jgi:hypothetical protein
VRDLRGTGIRRAAVTGLVLATALLTGCTEKTEANDTLPPTSAAPTTEALPPVGPADFPVPDEARTKDAAGAEAFLRYFIDLMNRQRAIPAGQPIRDLGPDCQECLRIGQVYDKAAEAGRRFDGGTVGIESIGDPVIENSEAVINFFAHQDPIALVDGAGTVIESLPEGSHLGSGMRLLWVPDTKCWVITGFTLG